MKTQGTMKHIKPYTSHLREGYTKMFESFQEDETTTNNPSEEKDAVYQLYDLLANSNRGDKMKNEAGRLLEQIDDVNVILFENTLLANTLLSVAAGRGLKDIIPMLLDKGADPNIRTGGGYTALHSLMFSVNTSITDTIQLLLKRGADVNAQDDEGNTALHWAARRWDAITLLKAGADPNIKNNLGETPIMKTYGNSLAIRELIMHGAHAEDLFKSLEELEHFFKGDAHLIPDESIPDIWKKIRRSKKIFGRG